MAESDRSCSPPEPDFDGEPAIISGLDENFRIPQVKDSIIRFDLFSEEHRKIVEERRKVQDLTLSSRTYDSELWDAYVWICNPSHQIRLETQKRFPLATKGAKVVVEEK